MFTLSLLILILFHTVGAATTPPKNATFPAIIVFGDSIVDPGNNNYIITLAKCDFSPYGRDFEGGKPTGRFSNGKLATDLLAEAYGVKELLPAYLDPNLQIEDLLTGVSFASGGSGYDPLTAKLETALPLSDQLDMFRSYLSKLKSAVGEEKTSAIMSKSLFIVFSGSNDIAQTYNLIRRAQYDIESYTDLTVSFALSFLQELYGLGARKVGVFSAPPIGCVPSQRTIRGGIERKCSQKENQAAILFNSKISSKVDALSKQFPDFRIVYLDVFNPLLSLIKNPARYGFEVVNKGCCGTGNIEVSLLCNRLEDAITCTDASKYIFWDSFHPTEKAYKIIASQIVQKHTKGSFTSAKLNAVVDVEPTISVFLACFLTLDVESIVIKIFYALGDSILDPGNNNYIATIVKCNFSPYGRDLKGRRKGRFSNGKIPADFVAEYYGVKELVPPYLDPSLQLQDLLTGVSFASGASGYDPLTSKLASALSPSDQLELFKGYISKVKSAVGEEKTAAIVSKSLCLISSGSDDIANNYELLPFRRAHYDDEAYANLTASYASVFIKELVKLGVRKIGVFSAPPIGCVPSQRTLGGGIDRECSQKANNLAKLFNSKLSSQIDGLSKEFPDSRIVYLDVYNPLLSLIKNPAKNGFEVVNKGCCGTGVIEVSVLCNKLEEAKTCKNASNHIFWDSYHPTEKAYKILTSQLINKYSSRLL
ncbi:Lipase_GDSL domain-containing protein [Cephalotus follicularis]|uniref:Lipase_GDSL domain-containing protein n=1 Tax=Cephalotus follicularis TaxID=3775 RepID=A0A1Q3CYK0_CEPFO|nr:Lipase_GDSL domain-containing protein [Cephalotus follicularis]